MIDIKEFWERAHKERMLLSLTGCTGEEELKGVNIFDKIFEGAKVLVIGVGTGGCCKYLKQRNCEVDALDISETGLNNVKEYTVNRFFPTDLLPENKYDFAVSNHVSQHMNNEDFVIQTQKVIKSLKLGGIYGMQFITDKEQKFNDIYTKEKCEQIFLKLKENRITGGAITRSWDYIEKVVSDCGGESTRIKINIITKVDSLVSNVINIKRKDTFLDYPPTHTFDLTNFEPTNILKKRVEKFKQIVPDFFKGDKLLDLATNKGGISFYYANNFKKVIGIDKFKEFIDFCNTHNKFDNLTFIQNSFRDLMLDETFDRIFIGNAHHYFFIGTEGHDWIHKLAVLSCGEVLIEGPTGMECSDMERCIPKELQSEFTFNKFMTMMNKYFILKAKIPSVSETPDRYVMLFERKKDAFDNKYQLKDLPVIKMIIKKPDVSEIFLTEDNMVAKITNNEKFRESTIKIASLSPVSNGLVGIVYDKDKFVGWLEEYNESGYYHIFENEIPLFILHCKNQVFLSKLGYLDLDNSGINHFIDNNKLFDKSDIYPIIWTGENNYNYPDGSYFRVLKQSYKTIPEGIQIQISKAFLTKDLEIIGQTYKEIIKKLEMAYKSEKK